MKMLKFSLLLATSWLISEVKAFSFAIKDLVGDADNGVVRQGGGRGGGMPNVSDVLDFEKLQIDIKDALVKKKNIESSGNSNGINSDGVSNIELNGQEGRRDLQSCDILLQAMTAQMSSADHCVCSGTLAVTCSYKKTCVLTGDICADSVDVTIDITNGVSVKYCSKFIEPEDSPFEDTCVTVDIAANGVEIDECQRVSYGFQRCDCRVCDDRTSLDIDCSQFNPRADTLGCQEVDLESVNLAPFVPEFMLVYRTVAPTNLPTKAPVLSTPPPTQNPTRPPTLPPVSSSSQQQRPMEVTFPDPVLIEIDVPDDKTCMPYSLLSSFIPDSDSICGCADANTVSCYYEDFCNEDNLCADVLKLDIGVDMATFAAALNFCTEYAPELQFDLLCMDVEVDALQQTIKSCNGATLGGNDCTCNLCGTNGFVVDCSAVDEYAYIDGCQELPSEIGPFLPEFQRKPIPETNGMTVVTPVTLPDPELIEVKIPEDKTCMVYSLAAGFIPDGQSICGCSDSETLTCFYEDVCDGDFCADAVQLDATIDLATMSGLTTNFCVEYTKEFQFELLCFELQINLSQELESCNSATLGGKACECEVCADNALTVDCSMHDPFAISTCQTAPEEIRPVLPQFRIKPLPDGYGSTVDVPFVRPGGIVVNIPEDKSCPIYAVMSTVEENNADLCGCIGDKLVCYYEDIKCKNSDGICAKTTELNAELTDDADGLILNGCTDFPFELNFEQTCVELEVTAEQSFDSCKSVTYGGKQCKCNVCADRVSVEIDCSEYNKDAKTGCQQLPENFGPFVPEFRSSGRASSTGDTSCALYQTLKDSIDLIDLGCGCATDGDLLCSKFDISNGKTKADTVEMRITQGDTSSSYKIDNCVTFDAEERYDQTCIITTATKIRNELVNDECVFAGIDGLTCQCRFCGSENKAIDLDCTTQRDDVRTDGCVPYEPGKAFVPDFDAYYDVIQRTRSSESDATRAIPFNSIVNSIVLVLITIIGSLF